MTAVTIGTWDQTHGIGETEILRVTTAVSILVLIITGLLGCVKQIVHTAQCNKQSFVSVSVAEICLSICDV
jgi:hypothetical protein